MILTPDKFFSKNYKRSHSSREEVELEVENLRERADNARSQGKKLRYLIFIIYISYKVLNAIYSNKYGRPSQYSLFSVVDETDETENQTYYSVVVVLVQNKVYFYYINFLVGLFIYYVRNMLLILYSYWYSILDI